jgi:hypothetical protein
MREREIEKEKRIHLLKVNAKEVMLVMILGNVNKITESS